MKWTDQDKLRFLVSRSWTVTVERDKDEGYVILRVKELPSVIATGNDNKALEDDFWESLQASLETALQFGDPIQLPGGEKAPWELAAHPTPMRNVLLKENGEVQLAQPRATGSGAFVNVASNYAAVA